MAIPKEFLKESQKGKDGQDHLGHSELFLISKSVANDLFLGVVTTDTVFACWGIILGLSKISATLSQYLAAPKEYKSK